MPTGFFGKIFGKPDQSNQSDLYAKAPKIYFKRVKGKYNNLRILSVWSLLGLYYIFPWIQWAERQAVLFDLPHRKFYWFGITLWPHDVIYLALLLICAALALFFFTALAGRLWCGYACPQTVWTLSFVWWERLIEGDRNQRMKLDKAPWSLKKIRIKFSKHFIWFTWAFFTGFTFVGYFTPIRELWVSTLNWQLSGWEMFWIVFYSVATWGNAGFLREQVCLYMCPYARFQSAMFDKDTLIIAYDADRGESRGHRKKQTDYKAEGLGDCVDCNLCVNVCPTGIDIRDGLQYECFACAACVDACNEVMDKMDYDRGLIRYTTEHESEGKKTKIFRPRVIVYALLLMAVFSAFLFNILNRVPFELDVIRDRNKLYIENTQGLIENVYTLKFVNMLETVQLYHYSVSGIDGIEIIGEQQVLIPAGMVKDVPIRVVVDPDTLSNVVTTIYFHANNQSTENPVTVKEESRFIGPSYITQY